MGNFYRPPNLFNPFPMYRQPMNFGQQKSSMELSQQPRTEATGIASLLQRIETLESRIEEMNKALNPQQMGDNLSPAPSTSIEGNALQEPKVMLR